MVCCSSIYSSAHGKIVKAIIKIKLLSTGCEFLDVAGTGGSAGRQHQQAQKGLDKFIDSRSLSR